MVGKPFNKQSQILLFPPSCRIIKHPGFINRIFFQDAAKNEFQFTTLEKCEQLCIRIQINQDFFNEGHCVNTYLLNG